MEREETVKGNPALSGGQVDYHEEVMRTLLSFSDGKADYSGLVSEWVYTGISYDAGDHPADCQLCHHKNLRYRFLLRNTKDNQPLWIGSKCVKMFDISSVASDGKVFDKEHTCMQVKRDRRRMAKRAKTVKNALA